MNIEYNKTFNKLFQSHELSVSCSGFVVADKDWEQGELYSPWSRLYYVMDGEGYFICDGKEIPIEPDRVYLAPCGIPYGFYTKTSLTKLFFHVNVIKPDGYDLFSSPDLKISSLPLDRQKSRELFELYRTDDPIKQIILKGEIWKTLSEFVSLMLSPKSSQPTYSSNVSKAISYIRQNLSASLKTSDVAEVVFCSQSYLSEKFKKEMGCSVAKYIDDLLMFEARRMLATGDKTVGEVSAALGFCDQFYFSRRFVKYFSVPPRDYKKIR